MLSERNSKSVSVMASRRGSAYTVVEVKPSKDVDQTSSDSSNSVILQNATPLSPVIQKVTEWYHLSILLVREPMRMDLREMKAVLEEKYFDGTEEWKTKNLFQWIAQRLFPNVAYHIATHQQLYFPVIAQKVKLPVELNHNFDQVLRLVRDLVTAKREFRYECQPEAPEYETQCAHNREVAQSLRVRTNAFRAATRHMLKKEEEVLCDALPHFTEEQHADIVTQISEACDEEDLKRQVPRLVFAAREWAGDDYAEQILCGLPAPVRILMATKWVEDYRLNDWELLHSLLHKNDPANEPAGCCVIL